MNVDFTYAFNELQKLQNDIFQDCQLAYSSFIERWNTYDEDLKKLLKPQVYRYCQDEASKESISIKTFALQAIILFLLDEFPDDLPKSKLKLTTNINDVDIAKLFYTLKQRGYISSTNEEIAFNVAYMFDLNENTILSYLSDPNNKMRKAKALIV